MGNAKQLSVHQGESAAIGLEANHKPTGNAFWQESWYFNFSDPKSGVWGLSRIGYHLRR